MVVFKPDSLWKPSRFEKIMIKYWTNEEKFKLSIKFLIFFRLFFLFNRQCIINQQII